MKPEQQIVMIEDNRRGWLDLTGAMVSWACVIHCFALPFFISSLPFVGLGFLLDESVERTIIGASVSIAAVSLLPAYFRQHGKIRTIILFLAGIGLIAAAHSAFEDDLAMQVPFLLIGAGFITAAHFINRRLCRECAACKI